MSLLEDAIQNRDSLTVMLLQSALWQLQHGSLALELEDGRLLRFVGEQSGPGAHVRLHRPAGLRRLFTRGDVGLAESYMAGDWDTPNLVRLLELAALNEPYIAGALRERPWFGWLRRLRHKLRRNSRRGSRRNIAYHYDLGNDFYRAWLDPGMTYSAALFEHPGQPLHEAQSAKFRRLIERLGLGPGDHVLEIGCGWGGFAIAAARETGCRVTAITLSREQLAWARERVREAGLEHLVELRLQDYRDLDGQFDHIASIEMFEAVGERYWEDFFQVLHRALRPGGRAAMQVITIDEAVFPSYRRNPDFIQQYIFPGGMLPPRNLLEQHARASGLRVLEVDAFGEHYADTLTVWRQNFDAAADRIAELGYDPEFIRMWRYYLAYCEAGFRVGRVDLVHTLLQRPA